MKLNFKKMTTKQLQNIYNNIRTELQHRNNEEIKKMFEVTYPKLKLSLKEYIELNTPRIIEVDVEKYTLTWESYIDVEVYKQSLFGGLETIDYNKHKLLPIKVQRAIKKYEKDIRKFCDKIDALENKESVGRGEYFEIIEDHFSKHIKKNNEKV